MRQASERPDRQGGTSQAAEAAEASAFQRADEAAAKAPLSPPRDAGPAPNSVDPAGPGETLTHPSAGRGARLGIDAGLELPPCSGAR